MSYKSLVIPKTAEMEVSRQTNLGVDTYDLDKLWSPDTAIWKSKVLDLGSPKHPPQVATAPQRYWFDRSRYNNHGAITGAVWQQLPSGVWVLSFDGVDDNILLPSLLPANGTVLLWLKLLSTPGAANYAFSNNVEELAAYWWSNSMYYRYRGAGVLNIAAPSVGVFAHHALTFTQGGTGYGYNNGAQVASGACSATAPTSGVFRLGCRSTSAFFLNCVIGEFLMYSRILTPLEIQRIYLATKWRYS